MTRLYLLKPFKRDKNSCRLLIWCTRSIGVARILSAGVHFLPPSKNS